jgi:hypothetical protein
VTLRADRERVWSIHLGVLAKTLVARGCGVVDAWANQRVPSLQVALRRSPTYRATTVVLLTDRRDLHDDTWRGATSIDPAGPGGVWWYTWAVDGCERRYWLPGFSDADLVADEIVGTLNTVGG